MTTAIILTRARAGGDRMNPDHDAPDLLVAILVSGFVWFVFFLIVFAVLKFWSRK